MKLGEIKAEALRLMGLDIEVNSENIREILETDGSWAQLFGGTVGAINRAFGDLEARRILPTKRVKLEHDGTDERWHRFHLASIDDCLEAMRLIVEGKEYIDDDHPFFVDEQGSLRVMDFDGSADYYLVYRPMLPRITAVTAESYELPLPELLAGALPYFIKGDIYRMDEPDEANAAKSFYEMLVERYASMLHTGRQGRVATVLGEGLL